MVTVAWPSDWPETCPCGGWPNDPGTPIPESPGLYNHKVVTHRVEQDGKFWAPVADLPRVQTAAEKMVAQAIKDRAKAAWKKQHDIWITVRRAATNEPLRELIRMHQPALSTDNQVQCTFCLGEFENPAEWPCEHWNLLRQLVT